MLLSSISSCAFLAAFCISIPAANQTQTLPQSSRTIGYTELQTNLPGGRRANIITMRAHSIRADSSHKQELGRGLAAKPGEWTQFVGWSPDGAQSVIGRGWESEENAAWEEEHKNFRFTAEGWMYDTFIVNSRTKSAFNATAVDRASFYNTGLFFWPQDSHHLGFTALIDGNSHPYKMDLDGHNKVDLTKASREFAYGFSSSKDGKRIAYHSNYVIYLADADGSHAAKVESGHPFNFGPTWSPDGKWVLFLSGEHYHCDPCIVRADGSEFHRIGSRGTYSGAVYFLDVPDFHAGSSDVPVWSPDSHAVYYAAQAGDRVELFRVRIADGTTPEQITHSGAGVECYHPEPSPDGKYLVFGCKLNGVRQLCVLDLANLKTQQVTHLTAGHAAMWPHWKP